MKFRWPSLSLPKISFSKKGKLQTKHILALGVIAILAILMLQEYGVLDAVDFLKWKKTKERQIIFERRRLAEFEQILREREMIENDRKRILLQSEEVQRRLLAAETPQLGAALLQDIVRQISEKNNISLRSFRILEPKDLGTYRKISLQIDFNPTSSMKNLGRFLYDLERHEKAIMISEIDLLIFNPRMANNIQGNLVITGLMPGSKAKERKREDQGKEATQGEKKEKEAEKVEPKGSKPERTVPPVEEKKGAPPTERKVPSK
jgi:hypothetical protein